MRKLLILFVLIISCNTKQEYFDIAIINGKIIDGTGAAGFNSTIYIKGDSIAYIGELKKESTNVKRVIDAKGRIISPGFIDLHSHGNPLETPKFENFLAMGVTSISLGQDGSSPKEMDITKFYDKIDRNKLGPNLIYFIGHGTLRNLSGIGIKKYPSEDEIKKMLSILDKNLKHSFGLTTGLEYAPGLFAEKEELELIAKKVGKHNRLIMSHMRNEDNDELFNSIRELAEQGNYAKVHISHLKSVYGKGEKRANEILNFIKKLQEKGIQITVDMYPYLASYTGISIVFPNWSKTKTQFEIAKKTRKQELEKYIREKVLSRNGPEAVLFGTKPFTGKTLQQVAKENNKVFEKYLVEDLGPQGASAAYFVMNKELQYKMLLDPIVAIGSDGSLRGSHPRGHGTFAKMIEKFVLKENKLSLEESIRKMTSYPAQILNLKNRGILKTGYKADLLIFNPENIKEKSTYSSPHNLAHGFDIVIINGKIAREHSKLTDTLSGKVLLPNH